MRTPFAESFAESEFNSIDVSVEDDIDTQRVPAAPPSAIVRRGYAPTMVSPSGKESVWPARFVRLSAMALLVALMLQMSWIETVLLSAAIVAIVALHRPVSR